jgi:Proteobacterial lipase chaperone protein
MNRSNLIIAGAVAAVVVTAVVLFRKEPPTIPETSTPTVAAPQAVPETRTRTPENIPAQLAAANTAAAVAQPAAAPEEDLSESTEIRFKANAQGRMVTDEQARLNLEKLNALFTPAERQKKLEELQATLPPAAARDLADMMERYVNYDAAQRQTFPPGGDLASPEDGLPIIDGMHNLRVQYFGADAANSMFGREEKIQRELLRLMNLETDGSLTIEEKAERAQAMYMSQMPETAAEIAAGRKQAEQIEAREKRAPPPKAN